MLNEGEAWIDRSARKPDGKRGGEALAPLNSDGRGLQTDSNPRSGLRQRDTDLPCANAPSVPQTVSCGHKKEASSDMSEIEAPIRRTTWSGVFAVVWFTCVVIGSLLPRWKHLFHIPHRFHLPMHFAVFALSTFVAFGLAPSRGRRIFCSMALIGLALVLETLQRAIYPIRFEWRDFVTDTLGVLAALLLVVISDSRREVSFNREC
jgi:hypothetical protein